MVTEVTEPGRANLGRRAAAPPPDAAQAGGGRMRAVAVVSRGTSAGEASAVVTEPDRVGQGRGPVAE